MRQIRPEVINAHHATLALPARRLSTPPAMHPIVPIAMTRKAHPDTDAGAGVPVGLSIGSSNSGTSVQNA